MMRNEAKGLNFNKLSRLFLMGHSRETLSSVDLFPGSNVLVCDASRSVASLNL